jgi:hypothetical protein
LESMVSGESRDAGVESNEVDNNGVLIVGVATGRDGTGPGGVRSCCGDERNGGEMVHSEAGGLRSTLDRLSAWVKSGGK